MPSVRICTLAEVPEAQADVADLLSATWPAHYGPDGKGDAQADTVARLGRDALPIGFVAITDKVVGTATLDHQSFGAVPRDTGVWLIGLAVTPDARNQGIAGALVTKAEAFARSLGQREILSTTRTAGGIFERRGWLAVRTVADADARIWQVYARSLIVQGAGI